MKVDPSLKSFLKIREDSHFSMQNLPYGVFRPGGGGQPRPGVAIGDFCLDLKVLEEAGLLAGSLPAGRFFFQGPTLGSFMADGRQTWQRLRRRLQVLLGVNSEELSANQPVRDRVFHSLSTIEPCLPVEIGDYTDFYSSREHATNVGIMLRGPENALMPNWLHLPVAYHGRASSLVPSGTGVRRPCGQTRADDQQSPSFGPSRWLDFELEMGFFIGPGSELGKPVAVGEARNHVFGMVLVNDWSARDIQRWEYVPLGPFLAKNFATTISPWIVTLDALEPFRCQGPTQDPAPLPYLEQPPRDTFDIQLEVQLQPAGTDETTTICRSNYRFLYWTLSQQLAHHTVNGCNVRSGDLMASGTISGSDPGSYGSLLELTWKGSRPLRLAGGQERRFLADGDRVSLTGWCQGDGYRVGFGECRGEVLPALG